MGLVYFGPSVGVSKSTQAGSRGTNPVFSTFSRPGTRIVWIPRSNRDKEYDKSSPILTPREIPVNAVSPTVKSKWYHGSRWSATEGRIPPPSLVCLSDRTIGIKSSSDHTYVPNLLSIVPVAGQSSYVRLGWFRENNPFTTSL